MSFKMTTKNKTVLELKSKGLSHKIIKPPASSTFNLNPGLDFVDGKIQVKFNLCHMGARTLVQSN